MDEFTGFDPDSLSDYSREKIYGKLGDLNHTTTVRNDSGTTHVQPWMMMAINEVVGSRRDLWKSQSAFIRDAIYHRLQDVKEFEWTTPEALIKLREGLSMASVNEVASVDLNYQGLYQSMSESLRTMHSPHLRQQLCDRAAKYALDCLDPYWAKQFRKLAEQA